MEPALRNFVLRFGSFEFETQSGVLRKDGKTVALQPQPARILAVLVSRPGEVVTREELRKKIWDEHTFVDFEHIPNRNISPTGSPMS